MPFIANAALDKTSGKDYKKFDQQQQKANLTGGLLLCLWCFNFCERQRLSLHWDFLHDLQSRSETPHIHSDRSLPSSISADSANL